MTDTTPASAPGFRVALRGPSGDTLVGIEAVPAAVLLAAALAVAPRLTAVAAVAALFRRFSLSFERSPA